MHAHALARELRPGKGRQIHPMKSFHAEMAWRGGANYCQISLCNVDIIDCHLLQSILILLGGSFEARISVPCIILWALAKKC